MVEPTSLALEDQYALSPMQQGMLFHSLDPRDRGIDVEQVLCTLTEPLDIPRFVKAWEGIIARYGILRTAFEWEGRPEPVQNVHHSVELPVRLVDWRHLQAPERDEELRALLENDRDCGFDLTAAPLMRLTIATCGASLYEVLWSFHHAILDGRSFPILLREVFAAYESGPRGDAAPARRPFRSYVDWLQGRDPEASHAFWTERLAGFHAPTPIFDAVAAGNTPGLGVVERRLTPAESSAVRAFAQTHDLTVGTVVTGAWALLLGRYTGEADVVFGTTRTCRHGALDGAEEMVGLLINTVPFRSRIDGQQTVAQWLAGVRAEQIAIRPHEQTPLPKIQSWSEVGRGTPMFETLLVFENYLLDSVLTGQGGAWANRRFTYQGQTNYPITFICYDDARMVLRIEYDRLRVDDSTAARMLGHVGRLMTALAASGVTRVADVQMLSDEERAGLLPAPRPSGIQTFCLHERFERRAAETPGAPALTYDAATLTYDEVNRRANQLAHRLRDLGVGPDVLVGLYTERSAELVIAILGVLKAGGAYVPLDPAYPSERVKFVLDDARVSLVVTVRRLLAHLPATHVDIICVDELDGQPTDNPEPMAEPDNLAYVIYTSGSTGRPKGVLVTHANVSRLFDASDTWFGFGREDVWTLFHSYAFDFSVWELWGALLYGGRLVVVPYWISRAPDAFIDLLGRERVTVLSQTPSAFRQLIDVDATLPRRPVLAMRYVVLGGEALEVSSLRPWFARHGDEQPKVINMFGITETTVHVTYRPITMADVDAGVGSVIGVPIADLDVYVLDRHQALVPLGVTGEIYVGGAGVARGYLDRPELTRDRFVIDPVGGTGARLYRSGDLGRWLPTGELEYRGRVDDQVKIRGFRIELGEIESVVRQVAGVRDAAVVPMAEAGQEQRLAAYVVLDTHTSIDDVRRYARTRLPDYMIPAALIRLDSLPLTANGKIDRKALPAPSAAVRTSNYVAPRNDIERTIVDVWSAVLRRGRVGVEDNFFELGGDSILSIQVIARCRLAGLYLTTRDVFKHPTIAGLAAVVVPAAAPVQAEPSGVGITPLTPISRWFFDLDLSNRNHWNQAFLFEVPGTLDVADLETALRAVVAHHDAFRLRFCETAAGWESHYIDTDAPVTIESIEASGFADDLAAEIDAQALAVHGSLNMCEGPLIRVVHFACGSNTPGRLLVVVHHIVFDAISWRIFLEDLQLAYDAVRNTVAPQFPQRTTSFKSWSERLIAYADGDATEGLAAWAPQAADAAIASLPCDHAVDSALNTERAASTITVALNESETEALLRRAPSAYGTHINDLLLSALGRTLLPWVGRDSVLIDVEGHGREEAFDDVDLSRTIGWFTTIYPMRLEGQDGAPGTAIKRTKEALRRLHHRGLSYGALRYLSGDKTVTDALAGAPRAQLLFNYLGQIDTLVAGSPLFAFAPESCGPWRAPENRRTHLVDVLAMIVDNRLKVQWTYCQHIHDASTMAAVAARFVDALRELVDHCTAVQSVQRVPSDLPLAQLTQAEVDELTRRFPTLVDAYPLSTMQQLFFSVDALDESPGFEQWEFLLEGPLDPRRLRDAWHQIVARHAILRTAFAQPGASKPYQVVLDQVTIPWHEEDWRGCTPEEQDAKLTEFLDADRISPFDLGRPPLMRIALIRMADEVYRLIWSTHHLLVDGWSWPVIFSELSALYEGGAAAATLPAPCSYREYVEWLLTREGRGDDRFWRGALEGVVDPTPIPLMPADRVERHDTSGETPRRLDAETTAALSAVARSHRVTLSTVLGAAWSLVLAHHSGRSDVVFGASFAGRPDEVPGIQTMVGPCVNNLPIRVRIDDRSRIGDWLRRLHSQVGELTAYQTTPLTQIHACSGVPAWTRLFDSLLVVQNYIVDARASALGDVALRPLRCPSMTNYPATVVVRPDDHLEIKVMRNGQRFSEASVVVAADDFVTVLESLASGENATIAALLARLPVESRGLAGMAAAERRQRRGPRLAPRTEMERTLAGIWRELFGGEIGTDENYFELGVHSLMLVRAHERICATVTPDLPIAALFQYPTVRDLAAHLTASAAARGRQTDIYSRAARQQQAVARRKAQARPNGPQ